MGEASFNAIREGSVLITELAGRVDGTNARDVFANVESALTEDDKFLVLDFADITYISSAGLRVVLLLARKMSQGGGQLAACALNPQIGEVFRISGFDRIINVHSDQASAVAALNG